MAFDPTFDTMKEIKTKSMWQVMAGFVAQREQAPKAPTDKTASKRKSSGDKAETPDLARSKTSNKRRKGKVSQAAQAKETNPAAANTRDGGPPELPIGREEPTGDDQKRVTFMTR